MFQKVQIRCLGNRTLLCLLMQNEQNKIRMVHLSIVPHLLPLSVTLKKQVGYFNHLGVVALVAITSGLCEVSFCIRDLIAQGN